MNHFISSFYLPFYIPNFQVLLPIVVTHNNTMAKLGASCASDLRQRHEGKSDANYNHGLTAIEETFVADLVL